jgi:histidinol-phosphatase
MGPDLALALELADAADALSLPRFRAHDLVVETKPDLSPVTETDHAVEAELRRVLAERRPDEAILGEEEGGAVEAIGTAPRWVIDPIDGTRNFSRGIPVWATLIALERDGRVECGVVSAPALGRRWWAARGEGAWRDDGERCHVSAVAALTDATVLVALDRPVPRAAFRAWHLRGLGDFWAHMLVAEGAAEIAIDAVGVSVWDLAAPLVIVEEAGGRFTDIEGRTRPDGRAAIASNGLLHEDALALAADRS